MKKQLSLFVFAIAIALASVAQAATISVQTASLAGLISSTMASASTGDKFLNDGNEFLLFINGSAASRTLTMTVQNTTVNQAGFNPITLSNPTVTLPGTGTNGGVAIVGPFGASQFNDSSGFMNWTLDSATAMNVAAIKLPRY